MAENLELIIRAKDEASKTVDKVTDSVEKLDKTSDKATTTTGGLWKEMFKGATAANVLQKGMDFVVDTFKESITAYIESEKVNQKLNSALRANGESVQQVGEKIDEFAKQMQYATGVDDEQVKSLEALARSYGIQTDVIDDTIKGVVGLTELYGGDYESNLKAVAKAYEGQWTAAQKLIPELAGVSSETEKLAILQQRMGEGMDAATERMNSQLGELQRYQDGWNNFKEDLGKVTVSFITSMVDMGTQFSLTMKQMGAKMMAEKIQERMRIENRASQERIKNMYLEQAEERKNAKFIEEFEKELKKSKEDRKKAEDILSESLKNQTKVEKTLIEVVNDKFKSAEKKYIQDKAYADFLNRTFSKAIKSASDAWADDVDITKIAQSALDEMSVSAEAAAEKIMALGKAQAKTKGATKDVAEEMKKFNDIQQYTDAAISGITDLLSDLGFELNDVEQGMLDFGKSMINLGVALATMNIPGIIFSVIGAISGLVKAIFSHKETFEEFKKRMLDQAAAAELLNNSLLNLSDTISGTKGWNTTSLEKYTKIMGDLIKQFNEFGADENMDRLAGIDAWLEDFGNAFTALMDKVKKAGQEGSASLISMFEDLASKGIVVAEVQAYINEQLAKGLEGYKAMREAVLTNKDAMAAFGDLHIAVFDKMIAYEKAVEKQQGLVNAIKGAEQALTSLSNTQKLTQEQFDSFAKGATTAYDKLIKGGMDADQALQTMAPYLQRLVFLQEQFGYQIDATTQKRIDEAKKAGLLSKDQRTDTQKIVDLLGAIAKKLGADIPDALGETGKAADEAFKKAVRGANDFGHALDQATKDREVSITTNYKKGGEVAAANGFEGWVAKPTRFLVGEAGPEYVSVTPKSRPSKGKGMDKSFREITVQQNITINGQDLNKEALIEAIKIAIPNNTLGLKRVMQEAIAEGY